jgi:hypothetical protein
VDRIGDSADRRLALAIAGPAPALLGFSRCVDGADQVFARGHGAFAHDFAVSRIADFHMLRCRNLLAADDQTIALHHVLHVETLSSSSNLKPKQRPSPAAI